MELWIRSQDREKITKVNSVNVLGFEDKITIHGYIDDRNHFWLGTYKSKKRALEVLDEIQTIIRGKYATSFGYKVALSGFTQEEVGQMIEQMAVYEMPKE